MKQFTIALAGNPNCGKTTLFNALTSSRERVGNWPGVTVEHLEGEYQAAFIPFPPGLWMKMPPAIIFSKRSPTWS